ncbi:LPS-assembly protein LptD, partial [Pseudomonas syringae]
DTARVDWRRGARRTAAQMAETVPYGSGGDVAPIRPGRNDKTPMKDAPMFVGAKASRYEQEAQVATLAGDVVLRQGSMQVQAQEAALHQAENRGELHGDVRLRDHGALIVGDTADLQLDTREARAHNPATLLHQSHIRGHPPDAQLSRT